MSVIQPTYDCAEAAHLLGISRSSVLKLIKDQSLLANQTDGKEWRVDIRSVESYLSKCVARADAEHKAAVARLDAVKAYAEARATMRSAQLDVERASRAT